MENEVMVTVYCLAYNHEKYIRDCLEGFVNQKVNFRFEVIVHDDASKDNTAQIIKEYAEKYPNIIKPIFERENQWSKKIGITRTIILPLVRGKYIAVCEGDDYWIKTDKLQKQFDALEGNSNLVACVHPTRVDNYMNNDSNILRFYNYDCIVDTIDVLSKTTPIFHTTSLFYRKSFYDDIPHLKDKNEFFWDYSRLVMLALYGNILYINDVMSVYRALTPGSWTSRTKSRKKRKQDLLFFEDMIKALKFANIYSYYKYNDMINKNILEFEYRVWRDRPSISLLFTRRLYQLKISRLIKMIFRCLVSWIYYF